MRVVDLAPSFKDGHDSWGQRLHDRLYNPLGDERLDA